MLFLLTVIQQNHLLRSWELGKWSPPLEVLIVKQEKGIEKMNTDVKLLKITH